MSKYTSGPWHVVEGAAYSQIEAMDGPLICFAASNNWDGKANARLIAAAPDQHQQMLRYLPIIERAESDPKIWHKLTAGLGIATANGYRAAIAKATGGEE